MSGSTGHVTGESPSSSAGAEGLGAFLEKAAVSRDDLISTSGRNFMDPFLETTVRGTGSKGVVDFLMVVSLSNTGSSTWRLLGFT